MNQNKIILGQPFAGALYAYFHKQLKPEYGLPLDHPYYATLYGRNFAQLTDLTLTFTLLHPEIILVPADEVMPDYRQYLSGSDYYHPDLGFSSSWSDALSIKDELDESIDRALGDSVVMSMLEGEVEHACKQILRDAYTEMYLADKHNCQILCSDARKDLLRRLIALDSDQRSEKFIGSQQIEITRQYIKLSGLLFNPATLDILYELKSDKDIRTYANSFRNVMNDIHPSGDVRKKLLTELRAAMEKAEISRRVSGYFNNTSTVLSVVGLIPILGNIASIGDLATDGLSRASGRYAEKLEWYELGNRIRSVTALHEIRKAIETELGDTDT